MCEISVSHPSYNHQWSLGYAGSDQGCPPKEKKRKAPSTLPENKEKHPQMTIALLEKKIEDISDVIYTLE